MSEIQRADQASYEDIDFEIEDLLEVMKKYDASDLHIKEGSPPTVRIDGVLYPVGDKRLSSQDCERLIFKMCSRFQQSLLQMGKEVDFSYAHAGVRYRVNAYLQKSTYSASIRMIREKIPTFEELHLPPQIKNLIDHPNGLVLVTGPAGSGKTTTLAAMVDYINKRKSLHIITIEDPIEYIHYHQKSIITQREVGTDTNSFQDALKNALRQDPNVILIGEMRNPETIMIAAQAAETGHLILSTLHTPNSVQAISRIIDVFSGENQRQIKLLLAGNLRGVVSQRLVPLAQGEGRIPAVEIMVVTPTIASLILEENINEIYRYIYEGSTEGMQTMNQSLYDLHKKGLISYEDAISYSDSPNELKMMIQGYTQPHPDMGDDTLMSWV